MTEVSDEAGQGDEDRQTISLHASLQGRHRLSSIPEAVSELLGRNERLHGRLWSGDLTKYIKKGGYKLINTVAQFHPNYKLLANVILDEDILGATCTIDFSLVQSCQTYAAHLEKLMPSLSLADSQSMLKTLLTLRKKFT